MADSGFYAHITTATRASRQPAFGQFTSPSLNCYLAATALTTDVRFSITIRQPRPPSLRELLIEDHPPSEPRKDWTPIPLLLMSRLREGRANTVRGAAHFLRETVGRVRYGGARGQLTVRAQRLLHP